MLRAASAAMSPGKRPTPKRVTERAKHGIRYRAMIDAAPPLIEREQGMTETANAAKSQNCPYCGLIHTTKCPTIKAYEYHDNGALKRVEFFGPGDYAPPVIYGPNGTHPGWPYQPPIIT